MNQKQKAAKQPQDPYAQHGKKLSSTVQRLRGWVGSDPSREPELADALVEVTAHRLLGHGYAAAAADAQESVRRAGQLLTANGPIGPYTSVADAVRYVTAVVHLATLQAAVGQPAAAGRTLESLQGLQQQLRELGLEQPLEPQTAVWALTCTARSALAAGDVAQANAYADAALAHLPELAGREETETGYLAMDVVRLASDCRWAAGRPEESLAFLHSAKDRYEVVVSGRLQQPSRLSPALVERLAEPLFGLYRDMADRLAASGEADLGLVTRRTLVELLRGLAQRPAPAAHLQLASALADLARDLVAAGRVDEADAAAAEAAALPVDWSRAEPTRLVVQATRARVLTLAGRPAEAVALLRPLVQVAAEAASSPAHAVGVLALAEALRADGNLDAARSTEQTFDTLAAGLVGARASREAAGAAVQDLARGVVSRGTTPLSWSPLPATAAHPATPPPAAGTATLRDDPSAWLEAERADAHRLEQQRLEQARLETERREAERLEAERAAAERLAAERAQAEQARQREAERRAAAEEAERLERKRRREERLEAHRLEVEQREAERREAELEAERREADRRVVDPAEAERLELQRLQAELDELERAEQAADASEPEQPHRVAPAVPEPLAAAEPGPVPEPLPVLEPEPVPEPEVVPAADATAPPADAPAVEPEVVPVEAAPPAAAEPDPLAVAQQAWQDARAQGDRRGARAALERLVELLRPRVETEPGRYGPQLRDALDALSSARLRSGDVWGSRAAAREAKALGRTLSR